MDTSKILQQCLHHQFIPPGSSDLEGGSSAGQDVSPGSIHIWSARYIDLDPCYHALSPLLTRSERETADTFRQPSDARCSELRYGLLRIILGEFTGFEPGELVIIKSETGKPSLVLPLGYPVVSFSTSHTKEMVAIGITKNNNIGIDIVKMDRRYPFQDTAEYLFSDEEKALIEGTEPNQRYMQFFRIWALKEALLKATGGTVQMMSDLDVSGVIHNSFVHDFCSITCQDVQCQFFIHEFGCGPEHHCAIAVNLAK
jgi:4'-phosphopantetheinyl transferase